MASLDRTLRSARAALQRALDSLVPARPAAGGRDPLILPHLMLTHDASLGLASIGRNLSADSLARN